MCRQATPVICSRCNLSFFVVVFYLVLRLWCILNVWDKNPEGEGEVLPQILCRSTVEDRIFKQIENWHIIQNQPLFREIYIHQSYLLRKKNPRKICLSGRKWWYDSSFYRISSILQGECVSNTCSTDKIEKCTPFMSNQNGMYQLKNRLT